MKINIQVIDEKITSNLRQRIRNRVKKLSTFYSKILTANVVLKKDNRSKDKSHLCEIRLVIRGNDLFGKSASHNFQDAASAVVESLRKRLRKKKTEKKSQRRKGRSDT